MNVTIYTLCTLPNRHSNVCTVLYPQVTSTITMSFYVTSSVHKAFKYHNYVTPITIYVTPMSHYIYVTISVYIYTHYVHCPNGTPMSALYSVQ